MHVIITLITSLLILALGLWLAWGVFMALRNGEALAAGGLKYPRNKRPAMFWLAVFAQSFFSVVCILAVVRCIQRILQ